MSGKLPRFLMTSIVSVLLAACGVNTTEAIPSQTEEIIESADNQREETQFTELEATESEEKKNEATSSAAVTAVTEKEIELAEVAVIELQEKSQERALSRLLLESHLDREGYSYYFAETDSLDFIEIEVRQTKEDLEHASLEGVYRYIIETEEILMRDYLSGDFITYEKTE